MHSQGPKSRIRRNAEADHIVASGNAIQVPSYGSIPVIFKSPSAKNKKVAPPAMRFEMSSSTGDENLRLINASKVYVPPLKWYKRLYVPGLVSRRSSPFSNAIRTTKYTILNFLPKNLFEQFHRFANIFFLFIALLNFIPAVGAVGKEVAFLPLVFVLVVTAAKDIFEDYRRFKSDREVNHRVCQVYNRELRTFVSKLWRNVRVGDFIKLDSNDVIPADLLFLQSSDPGGICYIETANIDGETNLKQRQVASGAMTLGDREVDTVTESLDFNPDNFTGTLHCEQPHNKIYDFNGYIETVEGTSFGVNKSNLLLQGCILRNTLAVVGVVVYAGHETKSMLNNSGPRAKRSKLERTINADIVSQIAILLVLSVLGAIVNGVWTGKNLNTNAPFFPFTTSDTNTALEGFIRFWTFIILYQVIIPVSLYVTIEIVKIIQIYLINWDLDMYYEPRDRPFQCRALNITEDLGQIQYVFSDKTGTLTENQMVFKCCSVGGANYPHGLADKLAQIGLYQSGELMDGSGNVSQSTGGGRGEDQVDFPEPPEERTELDESLVCKISESDPTVKDFFIVMAICNTVVVSNSNVSKTSPTSTDQNGNVSRASLTASDRNGNGNGSNTDLDIAADKRNGIRLKGVRTMSKSEVQELRYEAESADEAALVQAARDYGFALLSRSTRECSLVLPGGEVVEYDILHMLEFDSNRKCMSVIVRQKGHSEIILYSKGADSVIFNNLGGSSKCSSFQESGFEDPDIISLPSQEEEHINGKRLSYPRPRAVSHSTEPQDVITNLGNDAAMRDRTQRHLDNYAKLGLRTLCMAKRVFTAGEYDEWLKERHRAEVALENRDKLLSDSAYSIEQQLQLLGATGIEDKLQTGVPEAIASLQEAGMKVWVLTGDKQETAINVGYSSRLIDPKMEVVILNASSLNKCRSELERIKQCLDNQEADHSQASSSSNISSDSDAGFNKLLRFRVCQKSCDDDAGALKALVVDGPTLQFALEPSLKMEFRSLAERYQAVICCRATPLQKAKVVDLVKGRHRKMTLAIGDGANDVSMIQKADVGVGIAGREGMQAAMASDFSMARFQYLVKLLLVHGHWSYSRLARLMLYFFYKNVAFATIIFWFQIFNAFSGSNPIDSINLFVYNLLYTSLPIGVMGVTEQDLPASVLLREKTLYRQGRCSTVYTHWLFWLTVIDAFYTSGVVFFVAYGAYYSTDVGVAEFGFVINISIVVTVSLHHAVEIQYWTPLTHIILWGSIIFTFIFNYIYCAIDTQQVIIDSYFVLIVASTRPSFWFVLLVTPAIALLPRILVKVFLQEVCPSQVMSELVKWKETKKKRVMKNIRRKKTYEVTVDNGVAVAHTTV